MAKLLNLRSNSDKKLTIVEDIDGKKDESKGARKILEPLWTKSEAYYDGDQWQGDPDKPVKNIIFTIVEGEVPILTDAIPGVDVIALDDAREEDAKMLNEAVHYVFDQQKVILKQSEWVRQALITGTCPVYVDFDPDGEGGEGIITIKQIPWNNFYPDPSASEINECSYIIIDQPMRIEDLKRRFGKKAKGIKSQKLVADAMGVIREGVKEDRWAAPLTGSMRGETADLKDMVLVEEAWLKDYTMEDIPEEETLLEIGEEAEELSEGINPKVGKFENHDAHLQAHRELKAEFVSQALQIPFEEVTEEDIENLKESDPQINVILTVIDDHIEIHERYKKQNPKSQRPKYPHNLRLVMKVGDKILYDGKPDVQDGLYPVGMFYCYKEGNSIWGVGEVKNIIKPQISHNVMDYFEYLGLKHNSNTGWIYDANAGVNPSSFKNDARGPIIKKNQGTEVRRVDPATISPQLGTRRESDKRSMEEISGITEATQGRRPVGVTSGKSIEELKSASIGRVRLKSRYLDMYSMPTLGQLVVSRIVRYWSEERLLRVYDKQGKLQTVNFDPEKLVDLGYDVRPVQGNLSNINKEVILDTWKELLMGQIITPQMFLEMTDLPGKERAIASLEEQDQTNALLEQLQQENIQLKQSLGISTEGK